MHADDCWLDAAINWALERNGHDRKPQHRASEPCPGCEADLQPRPWEQDDELTAWWVALAREEAARVVPKAVEYSATDLADIGHALARSQGRQVTNAQAAELGVAFYALGKMSRIMGAIGQGVWPSDDSWHDLGVYARMTQRIRSHGGWPAVRQIEYGDAIPKNTE